MRDCQPPHPDFASLIRATCYLLMPDHQELPGQELRLSREPKLISRIIKIHLSFNWSKTMNIFYIIGVVVVILVVAGFLGLHV